MQSFDADGCREAGCTIGTQPAPPASPACFLSYCFAQPGHIYHLLKTNSAQSQYEMDHLPLGTGDTANEK